MPTRSPKTDPGRRSLELRKLLRRFIDVCNAIDYAHSRGVLHRDIKPGNIIIGKHGETLVVDWGLAKAIGKAEPARDERPLHAQLGQRQCRDLARLRSGHTGVHEPRAGPRRLDQLGPRSDVYSLGATLYCLLTGRPPSRGTTSGRFSQVAEKPNSRRPSQLDSSIDPALEAVCMKAMALSPDDRYASCRALADDVERWMADEPIIGLARASEPAGPAVGEAASYQCHGRGRGRARGTGRDLRGARRADPGQYAAHACECRSG